jgi:hypothetical protein
MAAHHEEEQYRGLPAGGQSHHGSYPHAEPSRAQVSPMGSKAPHVTASGGMQLHVHVQLVYMTVPQVPGAPWLV